MVTRVLYVDHTSVLGGGELSLLELLAGLPRTVSPVLACPEGPLAEGARELAVPVVPVRGFEAGFGLHPFRTPLALAELVRAARAVRRAIAATQPDVVHANSIRAALVTIAATRRGGPPVVAHVRDCLPGGTQGRLVRRAVCWHAFSILATSRHAAARFVDGLGRSAEVAYPSVDTTRFDPQRISPQEARARLGLTGDGRVLGIVGQLTPWKGQLEAIRTLALVRQTLPDARLLIAGSVKFASKRFDNRSYEASLQLEAERLGVADAVLFLGERSDLPEVMRALHLLLVPSWEEPLGRVVLEGMAMELPVLATDIGGPREVIEDGHDGFLLPPRRPELWAEAAIRLLSSPERRAAIGRAARLTVHDRFRAGRQIEAVLAAYVAAGVRGGAAAPADGAAIGARGRA